MNLPSAGTVVSGVTYNAASQPVQTVLTGYTENDAYNALNQLTQISAGGWSENYNYSASQNNGQVASTASGGQTVTYGYDGLSRLTSAVSSAWSQAYTYDGFGNLTAKTGSGSVFVNGVDATTNRLTGVNVCYDANGNMLSDTSGGGCGTPSNTFDAANRLTSAKATGGGTENYVYGADNKRVAKFTTGYPSQLVYLYGAGGELLGTTDGVYNVYWAGRLIQQGYSPWVVTDRLWSVRKVVGGSSVSYLPYGEDATGATTNGARFATYLRDGGTGLDYADQRCFTSKWGRFMSADPYRQAPSATDSASWNKYLYTRGDPVNRLDHSGTNDEESDDPQDPCLTNPTNPACVGGTVPPIQRNPGGRPKTPPPCNPNGNPTIQKKLDFVLANYGSALAVGNGFLEGVLNPGISANALATMFLQWSIGEGGYPGDSVQTAAQHNFFGFQNAGVGGWSGLEIACPQSRSIPNTTTNACFSMSTSWVQELGAALGSASGKTGITYGQALENALIAGASNAAQALQAIATNGWNSSATYGYFKTTDPAGAANIGGQIDCLKSIGAIP